MTRRDRVRNEESGEDQRTSKMLERKRKKQQFCGGLHKLKERMEGVTLAKKIYLAHVEGNRKKD